MGTLNPMEVMAVKRTLAAAVTVLAAVLIPVPADATNGCVTRAEYDNLEWGLSTQQVANRFDTNGWFIATGDQFFKRGYNACWDSGRKVVVWYSLDLGLSDHWDIRDQ